MEIDSNRVIDDLLEQNKQLTFQLSLARSMIAQLQELVEQLQSEQKN